MYSSVHDFHIPVMGTGHSADTPLRVAPWGIDSVVSLVDDILLEQIRVHYCKELGYEYETVSRRAEDGRAQRITAYFDFLHDEIQKRFKAIQNSEFNASSDKDKYFRMLSEDSELKIKYNQLLTLEEGPEKTELAQWLTSKMKPGSIDGNIMVKLDAINYDRKGQQLEDIYSDAKAALRGFANSKVNGAMVYSAGINQSLYAYMAEFKDFYPENSQAEGSSDNIWSDRETFNEYNQNFVDDIEMISLSIELEDNEMISDTIKAMTANCSTCHKKFRN